MTSESDQSISRDSAGQSADDVLKTSKHHDDLRTRIAKAVYALIQAPVRPFDEQPDHIKAMWFEEADAVIRELGLQREDGECLYCHAQLPCGRYVAWDKDTDE